MDEQRIKNLIEAVEDELRNAISQHPPMNSAHEGYAVLLEELDELKQEVWKKPAMRSKVRMAEEAIQIAAMAIRFVHDLL
jgi:hypothetical protein